ncbi:hypothetical protein Tco_1155325 [Tanacetum coccineum]
MITIHGSSYTQEKLDSEFNDDENKLEMADTQAEIILSQGLPRHIFNILNQTSTAKEIWDNVEMLMQGSGRTLQQRKEDLDEVRTLSCNWKRSNHDYFFAFHKLVNDMKNTQLEIPTLQMNTNLQQYFQPMGRLPRQDGGYVTTAEGKDMFLSSVQNPREKDSQYFKDKANLMEAKEKGDV